MKTRIEEPGVRQWLPGLVMMAALALSAVLAPAAGVEAQAASHDDSLVARVDGADRDTLDASSGVAGPGPPAQRGPYVMPPLMKELRSDLHNKVIHFPIALSLAGFALLIASRRRPGLEPGARALIWTAALFGVVAYFAGRAQEGQFDGKPKEWLVHVHERWGIGAVLGMVAWGVIASWGAARPLRVPWGVLVVIAVLVTAYLGGIVAHGH